MVYQAALDIREWGNERITVLLLTLNIAAQHSFQSPGVKIYQLFDLRVVCRAERISDPDQLIQILEELSCKLFSIVQGKFLWQSALVNSEFQKYLSDIHKSDAPKMNRLDLFIKLDRDHTYMLKVALCYGVATLGCQ